MKKNWLLEEKQSNSIKILHHILQGDWGVFPQINFVVSYQTQAVVAKKPDIIVCSQIIKSQILVWSD